MLCVVLLQLVTLAKNAPIRRCFELAHIFPPCTVIACVVHPCELLAAYSLPGAQALRIGRITRLHYLSFNSEEGSISGASRQNYLSLPFREHHEAVTILLRRSARRMVHTSSRCPSRRSWTVVSSDERMLYRVARCCTTRVHIDFIVDGA
jgi:hypothetical protein